MQKRARRSDGRLQAQVYLGMKDGKKQYKCVYAQTVAELEEKKLEVKLALRKGIEIYGEFATFGEWAEEWLKLKEVEVSYHSYITYRGLISHLSIILESDIKRLKTADIQNIIISLSKAKNKTTQKFYSKKTLKDIKRITQSIFQLAIENRVIDYNPASAVKLPKDAPKTTKRALTKEERQWIIDTPHRAQIAAMVMMFSGLRRGELLALEWKDIDLDIGTISVNKSVEYINGVPKIKNATKTVNSIRTVYIPDILIDFLASQERKSELVCPSAKGVVMSAVAWRRLWDSYLLDLDIKYGNSDDNVNRSKFAPIKREPTIPHFTAHWLRHTFITLMYHSGVDILTAKEQAGHADIKTTMEIYTHLDKKFKQNSMSKVNDYLNE